MGEGERRLLMSGEWDEEGKGWRKGRMGFDCKY